MRLFFALSFADNVKRRITLYRDLIADRAVKGRFSREENFHLTLAFIGDCNKTQLQALMEVLASLRGIPETVKAEHFGSFQRKGSELVWLGIERQQRLMQLKKQLDRLLNDAGFNTEKRKYTPHITLGRDITLGESLSGLMIAPFTIDIHSVAIMESKISGGVLVYETLAEVLFGD